MQTTTTIADRILENLMGGNGAARATRLGVHVPRLCERIATSKTRDRLGNVFGYTFLDGSELECHGGGWDTPEGWASND
jgi:hypothetical protein